MTYLCLDCAREADTLRQVVDRTRVPYGDTWVTMETLDAELCPHCASENVRELDSSSTSLPE
jgi:Zn finger protein HypA/HybF involved in hydrogenase expression